MQALTDHNFKLRSTHTLQFTRSFSHVLTHLSFLTPLRGYREGILILTLAEMRLHELRLFAQGHVPHNWQRAPSSSLTVPQEGCTQICLPVHP